MMAKKVTEQKPVELAANVSAAASHIKTTARRVGAQVGLRGAWGWGGTVVPSGSAKQE